MQVLCFFFGGMNHGGCDEHNCNFEIWGLFDVASFVRGGDVDKISIFHARREEFSEQASVETNTYPSKNYEKL